MGFEKKICRFVGKCIVKMTEGIVFFVGIQIIATAGMRRHTTCSLAQAWHTSRRQFLPIRKFSIFALLFKSKPRLRQAAGPLNATGDIA